jgi:hypothetical protein
VLTALIGRLIRAGCGLVTLTYAIGWRLATRG